MNTSSRCTATVVIALTVLAADVQAFTCSAVRNSARFGDSYLATTRLQRASTSTTSLSLSVSRTTRCGPLAMSEMAEDYPSDTGDDRFSTGGVTAEAERVSFTAEDSPEVTQLKLDLLRIAALTGRGQLATCAERNRVEDVIWELEMRTPIEETAASEALVGRWALVYASEDATRSSPFFWAFRKATEALKAPFGGAEEGGVAATIFAVTDSLPGKSVGEAVQTITANEMKSEVEIFAGASAGSDRKGDGATTFAS